MDEAHERSAGREPREDRRHGVAGDPQRVWATVEADDKGGIYRSTMAAGRGSCERQLQLTARQSYYGHIFADPAHANTVYTSARSTLQIDGRRQDVHRDPDAAGDYHTCWIDPKIPSLVNAATAARL